MKTKPVQLIAVFLLPVLFSVFTPATAMGQQPRQSGQSGQQSRKPQHPTGGEMREISEQFGKLSEFYRIMAGNYLDTMNYGAVVEKGITSMLAELDPHSVYLTAKELQTSNEELGGGFSGIGIEYGIQNDTIIVVNTVAGAPAEKVGMLPGDRIVVVDGEDVVGVSRADVPGYLRGPKGTKVELKLFRRGTGSLLNFTIVRDDIPINTIDAVYKPDRHTGYIRVNRFGSTTGREFSEAFDRLGTDVDGLILDLRGNGGGFLPEAIRMSEFFLDKGQRIVSTEGNMYPTQTYDAENDGRFNRGRLMILVDELSASASEIVAGAVQDWDRGIVVGNSTFGKGLVQRQFPLTDGSAVRLTIAKYLTPAGRAIQRPYERGNSEEYYRNVVERYNTERYGELSGDTASVAERGERFLTLRSGRRVYGGDGIRPDIVLSVDTTDLTYIRPVSATRRVMPVDSAGVAPAHVAPAAATDDDSPYWARLYRNGRLQEFVQSYLDKNRASLVAGYPDIESYLSGFDAYSLLPALEDYAAAHGVERDAAGLESARHWLAAQIKALIAQRLWDTTAYLRVAHATFDTTFKRAHAMMSRWQSIRYKEDDPITESLVRRISE